MKENEARALIADLTYSEKLELLDEIERLMQNRERAELHPH